MLSVLAPAEFVEVDGFVEAAQGDGAAVGEEVGAAAGEFAHDVGAEDLAAGGFDLVAQFVLGLLREGTGDGDVGYCASSRRRRSVPAGWAGAIKYCLWIGTPPLAPGAFVVCLSFTWLGSFFSHPARP